MLDIKYIRQEPDEVKKRLIARGEDAGSIDELLLLDKKRRALVTEAENLQAELNAVSNEIGGLIGQGQIAEAEAKKTETRELGYKTDALSVLKAEADIAFKELLLTLPNLAHESVPTGEDANANTEIKVEGVKPSFDFKPKDHLDLCESLDLIDFERGAKLTGSGFLLYTNCGARL